MSTMHSTLQSVVSEVLEQKIWNVRRRFGSSFAFEMGEKVETDRGAYHFVLENCHWWLQKNSEQQAEDLVNSESSQATIDKTITILNDKKLKTIEYNEKMATTVFHFDGELQLLVAPYGNDKVSNQWSLFPQKQNVMVLSDGQVTINQAA